MASGRVNIKNSADLEAGIDIILGVGQTIAAIRVFDSNGNLLSTYGQQPAVVTNPAAGQNVIQAPTDNVAPLTVKAHSNTSNVNTFAVEDPAGLNVFTVDPTGQTGLVAGITSNHLGEKVLSVANTVNSVGTLLQFLASDGAGNFKSELAIRASAALWFLLATSVASDLEFTADITPIWFNNVSGAQTGGLALHGWDFNGGVREFIKGGSNGTAAVAGFLGAPAVVQQPTASTAGIAGIRTDTIAHAVADIQMVLTALRAWAVTNGLTANTA